MSAMTDLAMRFIKPRIEQVIEAIDQRENLMEAARSGEDIVPVMSERYLSLAVASLSPYVSFIAPYFSFPDFQSSLHQIIRQSIESIEESATTDAENKERTNDDGIAAVACLYPDWLFDQARRMANLILVRLMRYPH